jgi:hypothetical protein
VVRDATARAAVFFLALFDPVAARLRGFDRLPDDLFGVARFVARDWGRTERT